MAISRRVLTLLLACVPALFTFGCSNLGKVEQGRVIAFDKEKGLVTVIRDSAPKANKPQYDVLPPFTVKIPADPNEMGPAPVAGKRLLFDTANKKIVVFDTVAGNIKTITYTPLTEASNVAKDDLRVKGIPFPIVDRKNKAIMIYSSRDKKLVKFTLADEYFALPDDTWQAGDDVRYYYKQPGQALRMMNVTRTDIMKQ
ncbi:MAG: DUF4881 domain-containing protein [Candidatus Korobacteraceae bacterium]|jgi:hypothetical protein